MTNWPSVLPGDVIAALDDMLVKKHQQFYALPSGDGGWAFFYNGPALAH